MAHGGGYPSRVITIPVLIGLLISSGPSFADDPECTTVKDCAEQMVALATRLKGENEQLRQQIIELQGALDTQKESLTNSIAEQITGIRTKEDILLPSGNIGKETRLCAKGSYMIGITFGDGPGGGHGIIHAVAPICRSL
ncbi:hypothetical protein E0H47_31615 [Rhizobium leguminosarum bv. viciae]|uniref:hypothetical protein n=1 Tax=Rhizobium leguminosarum TaxID=384 RepID=UPI00103CBC4C|nr:hypothetical protein [Rhizobium leguminosarum]TBZ30953.1 hypothetical protein E0H47_31615 [Rhizobium leguminosarum bv. viciae]